jgi:hypothetical protein
MGHLRLLYCDSAGVRRCRFVVAFAVTPAQVSDTSKHTFQHKSQAPYLCKSVAVSDLQRNRTCLTRSAATLSLYVKLPVYM